MECESCDTAIRSIFGHGDRRVKWRLQAITFCAVVVCSHITYAQSLDTDVNATTTADAAASDSATGAAPAGADAPAQASPERPSFRQRMQGWVRDVQLLERINATVDGWYPRIGGITRGSGFSGGGGYRTALLNDALFADVSAALSVKGYSALDAKLRVWQGFSKRVDLITEFRVEDFPEETYFGVGMDTSGTGRTSYDFDSIAVRTRLLIRPNRWARITTLLGYMRADVGHADSSYPSTEERFTDAEAPGLLEQPDYLQTTVAGEIDYRDTGGNTSKGGYYRASFNIWNDATFNAYDFRRTDMQVAQFVPVTPGGAHVVSGRVGAVAVSADEGSRVPFYYLAYAGGMDTIRSLREFRFRDRNAMWLSGEYKWRLRPRLSVSAFADVGQVSPDWHSLRTSDMDGGYGASLSVYTRTQTLLRLDVGTGAAEGWQLFIKLRPMF